MTRVIPTDEPWFVHASYIRPHPPYVVPAPFHDRYDPADVPLPIRSQGLELERAQHPLITAALSVGGVAAPEDGLQAPRNPQASDELAGLVGRQRPVECGDVLRAEAEPRGGDVLLEMLAGGRPGNGHGDP